MATIEERSDGRTVQLKRVRLSYCDSLKDKKPTTKDGTGKPKHTLNLILDPNDPVGKKYFEENKQKAVAGLKAAGEAFKKKPDLFKTLMEDEWKRCCFRKGEKMKNGDGVVREHYKGTYWIAGAGPKAGDKRPTIKRKDKSVVAYDDILDVCYGGVYADVVVSFYGTDKGGGDGIFNSIEVVRSWETGDRFPEGGGIHVDDDDFDDDDDDFAGASSKGDDDIDF
jgi:hypothetical protein